MTQIPLIIRRIIADPDTRQAVATIWNSFELSDEANRDMPCTVAVAFAVRGGHLYMTTFMRSNDVWLGVAYDYGMFTRLQITLAWVLGVGIGEYTHTVANLHVYERDVDKTYQLHAPEGGESVPVAPIPLGWEDKVSDLNTAEFRWYSVRRWMEAAVLGQEMPYDAPEEARWYGERLKPHASGLEFHPVSRYVLPRADS
jgi:thymidylate synthase